MWAPYYNGCNYQYFSGGDSINGAGGHREVYRDSFCTEGRHALKRELVTSTTLLATSTVDMDSELPEG